MPPATPAPLILPAPPFAPRFDYLLAGYHGVFFLRDAHDRIRLYPKGRLHAGFATDFGPSVAKVSAADGAAGLGSRFFIKRARPELAGEIGSAVSFNFGIEFGGQALSNGDAKQEKAAAAAGKNPTSKTATFSPVQSPASSPALADVWINFSALRELNLLVGQSNGTFSMENRTSDNSTALPERQLAIRSFVYPSNRETGLTLWGDVDQAAGFHYEASVYGGDGFNRPQVDHKFDFAARAYVRPFARANRPMTRDFQIGVSGTHGVREERYVGYDYAGVTTMEGFFLWKPTYTTSKGRLMHVIPQGYQNAIGGEVRLPVSRFELRTEAYYVRNETREALDGYQFANTERNGAISGMGWYVQTSFWAWGDPFVNGTPGVFKPTTMDLTKPLPIPKKGLEIVAGVSRIDAAYRGASRRGKYDAKTPGSGTTPSSIQVMQVTGAANYWHDRHLRLTVAYAAYLTPGSGRGDNLASVPGNLAKDPDAHVLHEISGRACVMF